VIKAPLITVVDDDDSVRESLGGLLRSLRLGVEVFASAEEFLRAGRAEETDCLILDVRMAGIGGLELQHRLVQSHPEIRIVFVTAHANEELRSRALKCGAVDFLFKPFSEDALLGAVHRALVTKG
jgi:FixJ family two-component response regulator